MHKMTVVKTSIVLYKTVSKNTTNTEERRKRRSTGYHRWNIPERRTDTAPTQKPIIGVPEIQEQTG